MKNRDEMIQEIKGFQNAKFGVEMFNDEDTLDFCVRLIYEIFIEQKHTYVPDLKG
ncbi:hypothetical protein BWGOE4_45070 [Bacillus mycoides]|nr:hypothetical protein BWGOE4_45070 [Bacillus mycoides]OFD60492.1 hypothetical protein BWGOE7_45240 [Bacillus mycoides]OFD90732.1 hypothetical protein BWGOE12_45310 [Bacillus mycoides]